MGMDASYANTETRATAPRADLVAKLLAFALDPSARAGEAENAARRMVTIARREQVSYPALEQFLADNFTPALPEAETAPAALKLRMTFGQYHGETLRWIAENDF